MPKKPESAGGEEGSHKSKRMHARKLSQQTKVDKARGLRKEKADEKRKRQEDREKQRKLLGDKAPAKEVPRTIENTREYDITMVDPDDEEVKHDESHDEMASYFNRETTPKVLITISPFARVTSYKFCFELRKCIPKSHFYSRKGIPLKKVVKQAISAGFTDIVVVHEDRKMPNAMILCHLPEGPTAYFKINSFRFTKDIRRAGATTTHYPELILNNFNTRLGHTLGRMFACLFPHEPQFRGRRVVTIHNQRDYLFFRHHRYEFKREGKKAALLELGPRFTLRLKSLQMGTFDSMYGEYEWVLKRHEMETSRRRFFL